MKMANPVAYGQLLINNLLKIDDFLSNWPKIHIAGVLNGFQSKTAKEPFYHEN